MLILNSSGMLTLNSSGMLTLDKLEHSSWIE